MRLAQHFAMPSCCAHHQPDAVRRHVPCMRRELFKDGYGADGNRVYDKVNGMTCHQCRQKTLGRHTSCSECQTLHVSAPMRPCNCHLETWPTRSLTEVLGPQAVDAAHLQSHGTRVNKVCCRPVPNAETSKTFCTPVYNTVRCSGAVALRRVCCKSVSSALRRPRPFARLLTAL